MNKILYSVLIIASFINPSFADYIGSSNTTVAAGFASSENDKGYYIEAGIRALLVTASIESRKLSKTKAINSVYLGGMFPFYNGFIKPAIGGGSEGGIARVEYKQPFTQSSKWAYQLGYTQFFKDNGFSGLHAGLSRIF